MGLSQLGFVFLVLNIFYVNKAAAQAPSGATALERSRSAADADLRKVAPLLADEYSKGKDYRPCFARELDIQKQYDEWFIKNYPEFQTISAQFDSMIASANAKIRALQSMSIEANPLPGQTTDTVTVGFGPMVQYFQKYNERLKQLSSVERAQLDKDMNHPERTGLGVAHDQVVAAMKIMTTNLNASLREQSSDYALNFSADDTGFKLTFSAKVRVMSGQNVANQTLNVSFLDSNVDLSRTQLQFTDAEKWSWLNKAGITINGYPLDGLKRYAVFQEKLKDTCAGVIDVPAGDDREPVLYYSGTKEISAWKKAVLIGSVTNKKTGEEIRAYRQRNWVTIQLVSSGKETTLKAMRIPGKLRNIRPKFTDDVNRFSFLKSATKTSGNMYRWCWDFSEDSDLGMPPAFAGVVLWIVGVGASIALCAVVPGTPFLLGILALPVTDTITLVKLATDTDRIAARKIRKMMRGRERSVSDRVFKKALVQISALK